MSLATPLLKGVGKPEREIGEASDPIDGEITLPLTTPAGPSNADHFFFSWLLGSFFPAGTSEAIESARHPVGIVRGRTWIRPSYLAR